MPHIITMPKQGQSVESCIITKWHKAIGEAVANGEPLFAYETDKAAFEQEATADGVLLHVFAQQGDVVPCLDNVCVIGKPGEDVSAYAKSAPPKASTQESPAQPTQTLAQSAVTSQAAQASRSGAISPRARNLAESAGVYTKDIIGTGPNGRIIERDILAAKPAATEAQSQATAQTQTQSAPSAKAAVYTEKPLPQIRKVISAAMTKSLSTMAQLTLNTSFDASEIMAYRAKLKASAEKLGLPNITLNDMVLYATAKALLKHPDINSTFDGEVVREYSAVNLGVAMDSARGLIVPTIFGAECMSLAQISAATKDYAAQIKAGAISPDSLSGGTFTVTNLGALGVESFTPIINPPQVAILGVCTITQRINADGGNYPAMGLSLTFDHRIVDGAPAARFLQTLCGMLENFTIVMAG